MRVLFVWHRSCALSLCHYVLLQLCSERAQLKTAQVDAALEQVRQSLSVKTPAAAAAPAEAVRHWAN